MTKQCTKCKQTKNLNEFHANKKHKLGVNAWCKDCVKSCNERYYLTNKEQHQRHNRNNHLKRAYKITAEQYDSMLRAQNGVCAICEKQETLLDTRSNEVKNLCVDHCHKTGKVRGLLCAKCNKAFGLVNEDLTTLERMQSYAKQHLL